MADINSGPGWTEAQWEKVNNAVTEAFEKASVAAAFIPCYGPLSASAEYVKDEKLQSNETGAKVTVTDDATRKLFNLTVIVELSSEQVSDESLSTALLAFRRAANTLAQVEDDIVFNGFHKKGKNDVLGEAGAKYKAEDVKGARKQIDDSRTKREKRTVPVAVTSDEAEGLAEVKLENKIQVVTLSADGQPLGEKLVSAVVTAISELEDRSHPEPFACILGSNLYSEAHRPVAASMVLPADRIRPLLNGPLLRSGQMDEDTGIVVSLAGVEVDIVVASPPKVQFLQVNERAKYLFRVYEKFRLRIKDETVINPLKLT